MHLVQNSSKANLDKITGVNESSLQTTIVDDFKNQGTPPVFKLN